jgi:uncharacterized protein YjbI with pentapeptide repeats
VRELRRNGRTRRWGGALLVGCTLAVVALVVADLVVALRLPDARDGLRGQLLGLLLPLAVAVVGAGALLDLREGRRQRLASEELTQLGLELSRRGLVADRFARAIDQLGDRDRPDLRIGAVYTLEALSRQSPELHSPVMEVLAAFLRQHSPAQGDAGSGRVPSDIRAALTVVLRRDRVHDQGRLDLDGIQLGSVRLEGAHLEGASLRGARLEGVRLGGAHLEGADLTAASLEEADLREAHLDGADLGQARLGAADLTAARLADASLAGAHLERANLVGAHLERADLGRADLGGARLSEAHLQGARLNEAVMREAELIGAHLQRAHLVGAHLERANLSGADLQEADLSMTHLGGAGLGDAHLEGADLGFAALEGAVLRGAHLEGADLSGAHLQGTALHGARMQDAKVTEDQLAVAHTDPRTELPEAEPAG